jgi:hypothetical protein
MDVKPDNQPTSGSPNSAPTNFDSTPALMTTSTTFKKPCSHVGNAPAIIVSNPIFELIEPAKTQPLVPLPALPQHRNQHHPPHLIILLITLTTTMTLTLTQSPLENLFAALFNTHLATPFS